MYGKNVSNKNEKTLDLLFCQKSTYLGNSILIARILKFYETLHENFTKYFISMKKKYIYYYI